MNLNDAIQAISEEINKDTNSRLVQLGDATDLQYQNLLEVLKNNGNGTSESTTDLVETIEGLKEYISATFSANEITSESIALSAG